MLELDLSELKGNEGLKSVFSSAVMSGSVPHTWVIEGPDGSGRHTFARLFCRVMMCESDKRPCGKCDNCRKIAAGHIDVHFIVPLKKEHKTVGVFESRNLRDELYITPVSACCKVYIFEKAESVTSEGMNALLKMTEEPPENVYFLLLTRNRHMLLPTILSRAVCCRMEPPSISEVRELLGKRYTADEQKLETALRLSGGYIGAAKSFIKGESLAIGISAAESFLQALASGNEYEIMLCGSPLAASRDKAQEMLTVIASAIGDAVHIKIGTERQTRLPIEAVEKKAANALGCETLVSVYGYVGDALNALNSYGNLNITVTELLIRSYQARVLNK